VLAANPATLPLTARFKKFFAQRTLAESTPYNGKSFDVPFLKLKFNSRLAFLAFSQP
jgi:uncharacterized protein YprB with RNaseH-like and TPR domain